MVAIVSGFHLFPFRTEKLSPTAPMVLRKRESRSPPSFPKVRVPSPVIRGRDAFLACSGRDGRSSFQCIVPSPVIQGRDAFCAEESRWLATVICRSLQCSVSCAGESRWFATAIGCSLKRSASSMAGSGIQSHRFITKRNSPPAVISWCVRKLRRRRLPFR